MKIDSILQSIEDKKCAKQTVIAIIINGDDIFIGSNWCRKPQKFCPRKNSKTGTRHDLCKTICMQDAHAEVNACRSAGKKAKGGKLFLLGHSYFCDNCKHVMEASGIKEKHIIKDIKDLCNIARL
ncbi:MAG: hypothetical protein Q3M24_05205 [Candidatus Electrothrix aestuarii]|uniref:CMP/dCMP-type deaminase domain-containing protein n=1 Tax=Candidatus Electrothrix aestuarii TaxID=3062594 RepID=A0AAU8LXZ2_9BACT|nr:hypothetical protein [Candidatus Electrothrix aestuarii]